MVIHNYNDEQKQYAKELHKTVKKNFKRINVVTFKPDEIWGADLVDMANKVDNDFRYILTVIDIYSRYAWAIALKDKKGSTVAAAFKKIGKKPEHLWVDKGSEFYNKQVKDVLKGTTIYSTESGMKSAYAERFNRTLKNLMFRYFTEKQTHQWVKILSVIVKEYNSNVHSGVGHAPQDIYNGKDKPKVYYEKQENKQKFKTGDHVRISKIRGVFDKGYEAGWTEEVFKVKKVLQSTPITYELEDLKGEEIKGRFYTEEMQATSLKDFALVEKVLEKKGNKVLVKYKGWGEKFNEWINKDRIKKLK